MFLSLNWLKDFVKYKQSPEQVAETFTSGGFETEDIKYWGRGLDQVIVGQIKTIISHAEANKLSVCKVDVGRSRPLTIVCGAKNIKPQQKVPVALVGTTLPNGMKIERRRIRGIDSEGMLCAEDELGLGEDHSGILILDNSLKVGQKIGRATGLEDVVLDLTVLPNRPDAFSVVGLAREYAALTGQKFINQKISVPESKKHTIKKLLSVRVQDNNLCPKYTARVVKNVKVGPSPQWLQARLLVSGIKPINNIVDISNYVMLEIGQPLHAFDMSLVKGKKIIVRKAGQDKSFISLDGEQRKLSSDMLMIADSKEPIAMAGVMGGKNSEISKTTKDIVIESAIFKPLSVRRTRQRLGMVTEASSRFEKGIYWELPEQACDRAAQLMAEIAGGEVTKGMIVVSKQKAVKPTVINVSMDYINKLIGRRFTVSEVKSILTKLYFGISEKTPGQLRIVVPFFRQDVRLPADVVEEIGRMYGWNNLKPAPVFAELKPTLLPPEKYWERQIKNTLVASGMTEVYNYSFYSKDLLEQFGLNTNNHYQVENPINPDQEYIRTCLLPRMFDVVIRNYQARRLIKIFEIGKVFFKSVKGLPNERLLISAIVYQKQQDSLSILKSILFTLLDRLYIPPSKVQIFTLIGEWRIADILIDNDKVGEYGEIRNNIEKLGRPSVYFTLDLVNLLRHLAVNKQYQPMTDYPVIERDMTFRTPANLMYHDIENAIKKVDALIIETKAVDFYKKSDQTRDITIRIICQSSERTLKSDEVDEIEKKIVSVMAKQFKMELKK